MKGLIGRRGRCLTLPWDAAEQPFTTAGHSFRNACRTSNCSPGLCLSAREFVSLTGQGVRHSHRGLETKQTMQFLKLVSQANIAEERELGKLLHEARQKIGRWLTF